MALRLFSIGYQGRSLSQLVDLLCAHSVGLVVDVRELPWSRKPGFWKTPLSRALAGARVSYEHARFAGNPKALRRAARSHDDALARFEGYLAQIPAIVRQLDALFQRQRQEQQAIALLCCERHPADCHRSVLLQHWRLTTEDTATPIVHLDPQGAPRFTARTIAPFASPSLPVSGTTGRCSG
jgi:uncharacterized protein (DUF488 family)